jgi:hypothetical protein
LVQESDPVEDGGEVQGETGARKRVLNRVVSATKEGIEYEGDQRHAETIRDVGLKEHGKGVAMPGVNDEAGKEEREVNETLCRAIAARANYLVQDRPNMQFAAQAVIRFASKPEAGDIQRTRKLGRYLKDNSKIMFIYTSLETPGHRSCVVGHRCRAVPKDP